MTHEQFIQERQYLSNVSPATVEWYKQSLRWLGTESPTADDLKRLTPFEPGNDAALREPADGGLAGDSPSGISFVLGGTGGDLFAHYTQAARTAHDTLIGAHQIYGVSLGPLTLRGSPKWSEWPTFEGSETVRTCETPTP